jgi:hypothetical protein
MIIDLSGGKALTRSSSKRLDFMMAVMVSVAGTQTDVSLLREPLEQRFNLD